MGRGSWHTQAAATPKLADYERVYEVTGWVEAVERSRNGYRWRLRVDNIKGLAPDETPKRVRVRAKTDGFAAGDAVSVLTVMTPPPGPVVPQGYDPARRAYFEQMGGYGFAIRAPDSAIIDDMSLEEKTKRAIVRFRYNLADHIREKAPQETAGLQAALLTGVRAYIPPEQTENLRVAGLAHVLAISGMHMGLLAGGSFWLAALILATISPLSRRYDVRKPAAIIGALAATGYLILSGASVATQRAYIMAIIVFLAVILDRRAFSMRSVMVAALVTLMFHPEALISVGFQMSFAAVAALVVVYREWQDRRGYVPRLGLWARIKGNFTTLTVTSFVAGTATSGFAVLHFNRIARYSLDWEHPRHAALYVSGHACGLSDVDSIALRIRALAAYRHGQGIVRDAGDCGMGRVLARRDVVCPSRAALGDRRLWLWVSAHHIRRKAKTLSWLCPSYHLLCALEPDAASRYAYL